MSNNVVSIFGRSTQQKDFEKVDQDIAEIDRQIAERLGRINTKMGEVIAENIAKKAKMAEERKKKNEKVKRDYRLTPKGK